MGHVVFIPELSEPRVGDVLSILGPEAQHATRVKRLEAGECVGLRDGRGLVATARIDTITKSGRGEWQLRVRVEQSLRVARLEPAVHVWTCPPKGDHLETMIDGLSQAGTASWAPLRCARTIVEPRDGKLARLARICEESLKQCGRAWLLDVLPLLEFEHALVHDAHARSPHVLVLADQSGAPWWGVRDSIIPRVRSAGAVSLLVGPEGGWTPQELDLARGAAASIVSFGPHAMRIETAAQVGAGCLVAECVG